MTKISRIVLMFAFYLFLFVGTGYGSSGSIIGVWEYVGSKDKIILEFKSDEKFICEIYYVGALHAVFNGRFSYTDTEVTVWMERFWGGPASDENKNGYPDDNEFTSLNANGDRRAYRIFEYGNALTLDGLTFTRIK